jgi:hypothetical protein
MSKTKRLPTITDAQRAVSRVQDHLHYLVHTIDFELLGQRDHGNNDEPLRLLRQELSDEFDDEYKTLHIEVVEFIIAGLERMRE